MIDNIVSHGSWEFNADVSNCFDDMISRSIPDYHTMRNQVINMCYQYIDNCIKRNKPTSDYDTEPDEIFSLLDIGCSNGIVIEDFMCAYGTLGKYTGIELSPYMVDKARERLNNSEVNCEIIEADIRDWESVNTFDIITAVLTLQFIPIEDRFNVVRKMYDYLCSGGICVVVEKVIEPTTWLDNFQTQNYYNMKRANGYTEEQIQSKRKALSNVLVPLRSEWNINMFKEAGFTEVGLFWKCLNFAGYILKK